MTVVATDTVRTLAVSALAPAAVKARFIATTVNGCSAVVIFPALDAVKHKPAHRVIANLASKHTVMLAVIIIAFVDIDVTFNTFPLVGTDTHRFAINLIKRSTVLAAKTAVLAVCSVKTSITIAFVRSIFASLFDPARAAV